MLFFSFFGNGFLSFRPRAGVYNKEKGAVILELSSGLSLKLSVSTAIHFWLARLHLNSLAGNKNGLVVDRGSSDRADNSGF